MKLPRGLKSNICRNEPASRHTTIGVGGCIPLWIDVYNLEELILILNILKESKTDFFVIGAGSNLIIRDKGIKKVFLRLDSRYFKTIQVKKNRLIAKAGASLSSAINIALHKSLSGLEPLSGIPASIGGAIYMNASVKKCSISDRLSRIAVIDKKLNKKQLDKEQIKFDYRKSNLSGLIIIEAEFKLKKRSISDIKRSKKEYLEEKKLFQPLDAKSAGCIFKNPANSKFSSGELIEKAGLKGLKIGGAQISNKHANYIVNFNNATASDIKKIVAKVKSEVKKKFMLDIEEEVIFV
jgi:UDP-N-acetylmuramate dehydrogenase